MASQGLAGHAKGALSVAQLCNEYVLLDIFQHLQHHELATSALVCQSWLPSARATLYRRVHFNTVSARAAKLETTLRSCAQLCSLVRHLWIMHTEESRDHLLSWIAMIPENSLLSLHLERMPVSKFPLPLFQYPAIRTTPQMTIAHSSFLPAQPSNLATILSFPRLEGLSLLVGSLPLQLNGSLHLQRLSLGIMEEGRPQMLASILSAITPTSLRKLDLYLATLDADSASWLTDLLRPHLPALRHLAIRTLDRTRTTNIVDGLIALAPHLESLACGRRTYTAALFPLLPPSLRMLTLDSGDNEPFPREELEDVIARLCASGQRNFTRLIIGRHPSYPNSLYFEHVERMCKSFGVSFAIRRGTIGEHLELGGSYRLRGAVLNA